MPLLNVAKGVYNATPGALPVPMIKEVAIVPSSLEEEEEKIVRLVVKVVVQTTRPPVGKYNLHVSAVKSENDMKVLKRIPRLDNFLRSAVLMPEDNGSITFKNVDIDSKGATTSIMYNQEESSRLYVQTIDVPMEVAYTGSVDYLGLMVVISETYGNEGGYASMVSYFRNRKLKVSAPAIETVLIRGAATPRSSQIFRLAESMNSYGRAGELWPALVHRHDKQLMAGPQHVNRPHPAVVPLSVPNLKLKDYRIMTANKSLLDDAVRDDTEEYISDLYFSRSRDNTVKIFFAFDFLKYINNNSDLAALFANKSSLLSAASIEEIKVYRSRVDSTNLGNRLTPDKISQTCRSDSRKLIARMSNNTVKILDASGSHAAGILEILALDNEMPNELQSRFAYSIEIEMLDNSATAVKSVIQDLSDKTQQFNKYMELFMNPADKNYDIDAYNAAIAGSDAVATLWQDVILKYVSSYIFLRGSFPTPLQTFSVLRNLVAFASPGSASEESLLRFKSLIDEYIGMLRQVITKETPISTRAGDSSQIFESKIAASSASARRLKYIPKIEQTYNNDLGSDTGYDYFDSFLNSNGNSFSLITYKQLGNRVTEEIQKYDVATSNNTQINKYGYFSPRVIKTPSGPIVANKRIQFDSALDLLRANTTAIAKKRSFKGNAAAISDVKKLDIEELLGEAGVSYETKESCIENLRDVAQKGAPTISYIIDSSYYFGATSNFVLDNEYVEAEKSGSSIPRYKSFNTRIDKFVKNPAVQKTVSSLADNFRVAKATNIPNITGSIASQTILKAPDKFMEMNIVEKSINFNSIVRVEYLNGYPLGVKGADWRLLDETTVRDLQTNQRPVLCRLSLPSRVLNVDNRLELAPYDTLFVLGGRNLKPVSTSPSFSTRYDDLKNRFSRNLQSPLLNNKTAGGIVLPQYLCSDMMIREDVAPARNPAAAAATTMQRDTTSGGSY